MVTFGIGLFLGTITGIFLAALIAEDIWDVIRVATGRSRWGTHLHTGPEPPMFIEKVGAEKE